MLGCLNGASFAGCASAGGCAPLAIGGSTDEAKTLLFGRVGLPIWNLAIQESITFDIPLHLADKAGQFLMAVF